MSPPRLSASSVSRQHNQPGQDLSLHELPTDQHTNNLTSSHCRNILTTPTFSAGLGSRSAVQGGRRLNYQANSHNSAGDHRSCPPLSNNLQRPATISQTNNGMGAAKQPRTASSNLNRPTISNLCKLQLSSSEQQQPQLLAMQEGKSLAGRPCLAGRSGVAVLHCVGTAACWLSHGAGAGGGEAGPDNQHYQLNTWQVSTRTTTPILHQLV